VILVDTSIWIESWKRRGEAERLELLAILDRDELATTGMVLAEVLQGAASEREYMELRERLLGSYFFGDSQDTWERAARLSFELMRRGEQTPLSDIVIAMVALENELEVYARDSHFDRIPGLRRYVPSAT
jgi:predicted nucleic acid-binding protein